MSKLAQEVEQMAAEIRKESEMATTKTKKTAARKPAAASAAKPKTKEPKTQKTPRAPKMVGLPSVDDLRLAPGGVGLGNDGNRYVNLAFDNGYVVRLFPVNVPKGDVRATRDLVTAWLVKRLQ